MKDYKETWQFNEFDASEKACYISENQFRTPLVFSSDRKSIEFEFRLGTYYNPTLFHKVTIPLDEIFDKYGGNIGEACIYHEYVEYIQFKKKFQESVQHDLGLGERKGKNTINKVGIEDKL